MTSALPFAIGEPVERIDGVAKVTGAARYTNDIVAPDALHAMLVPARIARGRIVAIDIDAALQIAGVIDVVTFQTAPRLAEADYLTLLQDDRILHRGQPIAMVIATNRHAAAEAVKLVVVTVSEDAALTGRSALYGPSLPAPPLRRGPAATARGDVTRALLNAAHRIERRYSTPTHNHNAMEPHAVLVRWSEGRVKVHTGTQTLFMTKAAIATALAISPDDVDVVCDQLGGGFGSKGGSWRPVLTLVVAVARRYDRPLRLVLSRAEMFTLVGRRQGTVHDVKLACDTQGKLTALSHISIAQTASFSNYTDPNATLGRVIYACPNVDTAHRLVATDEPMPVPMRAPGEGPGSFAIESAMDELAYEIAMDPLEFRRRNYASHDQHRSVPWSSNGLLACYEQAATSFGWSARVLAPRQTARGCRWIGTGMATALYPAFWAPAAAAVAIDANGILTVSSGTQEIGTGNATIMAQIASATLGWPRDAVRVQWGDSDLPEGPPSVGSMGAASIAPAVANASAELRTQLERHFPFPFDPTAVAQFVSEFPPGTFWAEARCTVEPDTRVSTYGWGAVFAEVSVDERFGEVRIERLHTAYAAGRILNRRTALSQYQGGLVFGIGMACREQTITDPRNGKIVNADLGEYHLPVAADIPDMTVHMIDEDDPVPERMGVKGVGMLGTVGTAAAIANAVFHATGRRVRDLPIEVEDLL